MILYIACSVFDLLLWKLFYDRTLNERKRSIPYPVHILFYILGETALFLLSIFFSTNYADYRVVINTTVSFILSFAITFLYDCRLSHKFFISACFTLVSILSEFLLYEIISLMPHHISEIFLADQGYGAVSAKLISLLFCVVVIRFFHRHDRHYTAGYTALIFIMPLISLVILMTIPARADLSGLQAALSMIGMCGLLLTNIINYYLLDNVLNVQILKQREEQLNQQVQLQFDKYQQISQAYRDSRSFIHDIKKQFFYIQTCLAAEKYGEIDDFLTTSLQELERTATRVNTGNLVIDSFVSNHMSLASREGIRFQTKLQIGSDPLPLSDYDLCLILGNLLDNSYQACHKIASAFPREIRVEIVKINLDLVIHIANTINEIPDTLASTPDNKLKHGFGMINVARIVEKNMGSYTHDITNGYYHAVVSIPYL